MKLLLALTLAILMMLTTSTAVAAEKSPHGFYELRIYTTLPGRLDALNKRFRDHTTRLFTKHGITNIGYFEPIEEKDGKGVKLYYLLGYPSREAREASWKAFQADPDWKAAREASEKDGKILAPKGVESIFLSPTDYSMFNFANSGGSSDRTFALRIYNTPEGKLQNLHSRFANHTIKLFAKHGMTNIAYFTPTEEKDGKATKLIYFLAHPSVDAHKASFASFRTDPEWVKVKTETEKDGSLTVAPPMGVINILLKPTDYSPLK